MSFRRDSEPDRKFSQWKHRHIDLILKCGIPQSVIGSEQSWHYFLEHGDTPDRSYSASTDPRLVNDRNRVRSLQDLIRSYGAVGGIVLPPVAFPWLYEDNSRDDTD